ncbi:hypothetical protein AB0D08_16155 [Kitasatospora sp. NPDC048540]|uniref:hypothetical protein n=1 Tax=unclassified Kitasatospora TaxID=2633591 RepID=UPI000A6EDB1B|nr:hypothetical protein [Kitasatospora sp. MBT63]
MFRARIVQAAAVASVAVAAIVLAPSVATAATQAGAPVVRTVSQDSLGWGG